MKKNLLLLCLPLAIILTPSCMKEDLPDKHHQQQAEPIIITVELIKNQTYHYTLPEGVSDQPFRITQQASHFITSEISTDKIYTYTPAYNYIGKDWVIISNVKEDPIKDCGNTDNDNFHHDNDNNNSNCGNNHVNNKGGQTINIYFVIKEKEQGKHLRTAICPSF